MFSCLSSQALQQRTPDPSAAVPSKLQLLHNTIIHQDQLTLTLHLPLPTEVLDRKGLQTLVLIFNRTGVAAPLDGAAVQQLYERVSHSFCQQ